MEFGISAFQDPGAEVNVVCLQRFRWVEHSGMIWDECTKPSPQPAQPAQPAHGAR